VVLLVANDDGTFEVVGPLNKSAKASDGGVCRVGIIDYGVRELVGVVVLVGSRADVGGLAVDEGG
jgi:hypothetical protein